MDKTFVLLVIQTLSFIFEGVSSLPTEHFMVIFIYETPLTWNSARKECERNNATLFRMNEQQMVDVLRHETSAVNIPLGSEEFWIGLHDPDTTDPGGYIWYNDAGLPGLWTNWELGEPDNQDSQFCVAARNESNGMKWNTAYCNETKQFICEQFYPFHSIDTCQFRDNNRPSLCSNDKMIASYANITTQDCERQCLIATRADKECWCLNYYRNDSLCTLHEGDSGIYYSTPKSTPERFFDSLENTFYSQKFCYGAGSRSVNLSFVQMDYSNEPQTPTAPVLNLTNSKIHTSKFRVYYLINQEMTWKEAECACQGVNGTLLQMTSTVVRDVAREIMSNFSLQFSANATWIGLISNAQDQFRWISGKNTYSHWARFEPQISRRCVFIRNTDPDMYWYTDFCSRTNGAICQRNTGERCMFVKTRGCLDVSSNSQLLPDITGDECEEECLNKTRRDEECWAYQYQNSGPTDPHCYLFFANHPLYYTDDSQYHPCESFEENHLKKCFVAQIYNPEGQLEETEVVPTRNCAPSQVQTTEQPTCPSNCTTTMCCKGSLMSNRTHLCACWKSGGTLGSKTIKFLITTLKINPKETTIYKRKFGCSDDDRISAKALGISGLVVIISVCCSILCLDATFIWKMFGFERNATNSKVITKDTESIDVSTTDCDTHSSDI